MMPIRRLCGTFLSGVVAWAALVSCEEPSVTGDTGPIPGDTIPGDTEEPPRWHYQRVEHNFTDRSFNDLWVGPRGEVYAVGHYGTIITNRGPDGLPATEWRLMPSPTQSHLTAIYGVDNGSVYGLDDDQGNLVAVGWDGTILFYNPNPDGDPLTEDGIWRLVAGPEGDALRPVIPVDPACPDYDGDGVPDDGDGSGFSGDQPCASGVTTACDDNCRTTPNGDLRPIADTNADSCIGPGDQPDAVNNPSRVQEDADGDGVGAVCDADDTTAEAAHRFTAPLFDVWARRNGSNLRVVAVGGDGAVVTFEGPTEGAPGFSTTTGVTNPAAWLAIHQVPYRFDNDCPPGTPPGQVCEGSGRIPPSCPAMCHPARTNCSCPVDQGQCCDATASTGFPAAPNACDPVSGVCRPLCPDCFRRQDRTLRAVAAGRDGLLSVGAAGRILLSDISTGPVVSLPMTAPTCDINPAKPLDERPVLVAADNWGDNFVVAGSLGAIFFVSPSRDGCATADPGSGTNGNFAIESRQGAPAVFISDVAATGRLSALAVGDGGTLLHVTRQGVYPVDFNMPVTENLHAIWVERDDAGDSSVGNAVSFWIVGAGGTILRGEYH